MNMNCTEYREAIAADPSESFDAAAQHVAGCESCAAFRNEMRALDDRIAAALSIPVPQLSIPELPPVEQDTNVVNLPFELSCSNGLQDRLQQFALESLEVRMQRRFRPVHE